MANVNELPEDVRKHFLSLKDSRKEGPKPGLLFAKDLLDYVKDTRYAAYIAEFRLKHPVLYFMGYKWYFYWSAPRSIRKYLPKLIVSHTGGHETYWASFAMQHPVLFLLLSGFQFFKKNLTAPIKKVFTGKRSACLET
jgi:hypothetical protein